MEQNQSGFKRFWYIWGAIIIKYVIAQLVYVGVAIVVMIFDMAKMNIEELYAMMDDWEQKMQFTQMIMDKIMDYAVLIEGVAAVVTIPVMFWFFHRDSKWEKSEGIIQKKAPLWKYIGVIVIAAAAGLGLNNLILLSNLSSLSASYEETIAVLYNPPLAVQLIVLGMVVPLCEEMVFRGVVYRRLRYRDGYMVAAVYSSLIFGVIHGNIVQMLYGFIMGMIFANLYERYGSVKAPILAHMVVNVISVVTTEFGVFEWLFEEPMRVGIATVLCAAVGSTMYLWIQKIGSDESLTD